MLEADFRDEVCVCFDVDFKDCFHCFQGQSFVGLVDYHFAVTFHLGAESNAVFKLSGIRAARCANRLGLGVAGDFAIGVVKHFNHVGFGIHFKTDGLAHRNEFCANLAIKCRFYAIKHRVRVNGEGKAAVDFDRKFVVFTAAKPHVDRNLAVFVLGKTTQFFTVYAC